MNSKNIFILTKNIEKQFDDAYVYGAYAPMDWLKDEILKIKLMIANDVEVFIESNSDCISSYSEKDFTNWIQKKYPELLTFIK